MKEGLNYVIKNNLTARECKIILALLDKEMIVSEIAEKLGLNRSNVQNMLIKLKTKGLISSSVVEGGFYKYKLA